MTTRHFGAKHDTPDERDHQYGDALFQAERKRICSGGIHLPSTIFPPIFDQGDINACLTNALARAFWYEWALKHGQTMAWLPSRLQWYWLARKLEGTEGEDAGAMMRSGLKVLAKRHLIAEHVWPYDTTKVLVEPPHPPMRDSPMRYLKIDNRDPQQIIASLWAGHSVLILLKLFDGAETAQDGELNLPALNATVLGNHFVLINAYDSDMDEFGFANSWGTDWGVLGNGVVPVDYVTNPDLAGSCWTIRDAI